MSAESQQGSEILIVDDDRALRETLADFLEKEGFRASGVGNVAEGRAQLAARRPALVLLDLTMPGGDGLGLASEIRILYGTPLIIISGRAQMMDRVVGLEVGADDYLAKPFELRELLARVRAVLRRVSPARTEAGDVQSASAGHRRARFGEGWELDLDSRGLIDPHARPIALTSSEFALIAMFVERPNRVLTRDQIAELTRREDWDAFDRSIDTQISRLRRKLDAASDGGTLIQTVRGEGYVLACRVTWEGVRPAAPTPRP
jgi:two-component system, OmpR family, response regulator